MVGKKKIIKKFVASALAVAICAASAISIVPNESQITADAAITIKNYQVLYLKQDSQSVKSNGLTTSALRKGYYIGYKLNANQYIVATNRTYKIVPASRIKVEASNTSANKILLTGAISQLGENTYYAYGCGPACVTMVADWELGKNLSKDSVINYFRQSKFNAAVRFSATESDRKTWCYGNGNGTPNTGVQYMVHTYATAAKKSSFYYSTLGKSQNQIIDEIDALLKNGHRVIACVKHKSTARTNGMDHNYLGAYTHWVVITAETGSRSGNYYIADPYYAEQSKYKINGNNYYYGLEKRTKTEMARSIQGITSNKIAGLITVKG